MVTQTVPELMTFKQTAQLLLGLRARVRAHAGLGVCVGVCFSNFVCIKSFFFFFFKIILDLLNKDGPPDSRAIQILINRLKVSSSAVMFFSFKFSFANSNFLFTTNKEVQQSWCLSSYVSEGCGSGEIPNQLHGAGPESAKESC